MLQRRLGDWALGISSLSSGRQASWQRRETGQARNSLWVSASQYLCHSHCPSPYRLTMLTAKSPAFLCLIRWFIYYFPKLCLRNVRLTLFCLVLDRHFFHTLTSLKKKCGSFPDLSFNESSKYHPTPVPPDSRLKCVKGAQGVPLLPAYTCIQHMFTYGVQLPCRSTEDPAMCKAVWALMQLWSRGERRP